MTPFEQELYYRELKGEVAYYKGVLVKKDWRYVIMLGFLITAIFLAINFLNKVVYGATPFNQWVKDYEWWELPFKALGWVIIFYFWQVRSVQKKLQQKTRALHEALQQNPSLEKPTP